MLTMTTPTPIGVLANPIHSAHTSQPVGRRRPPTKAHTRPRRHVLYLLVGADSGPRPHIPRRRPRR
jgi:hypothetical protein